MRKYEMPRHFMIFLSLQQTIKFNEHMSLENDNTSQTKHIAVLRDKTETIL
jgi:hypothetical protein